MRNGECTSKMYTLYEGVHKNVLPLFPITRFLRLGRYMIYGFWYSIERCQSVTLRVCMNLISKGTYNKYNACMCVHVMNSLYWYVCACNELTLLAAERFFKASSFR